ncbi:cyanase [Tylopilus felleus]
MSLSQAASIPSNNQPYADLPPVLTRFFEAKARKGLSFEKLAQAIGRDEIWVAAAFYGQAKLSPEEVEALARVLDIPAASIQSELGPHWWPSRGLGPSPPTDPVIYRLYEAVLVYGHAIKSVINEKFGDGIMSMIDCKVNVTKKPDPKGDRVVLTFDGKFLPYAKW